MTVYYKNPDYHPQLELAQLWALFKATWTAHDRDIMLRTEGHWCHRSWLPPPEQKWYTEFAQRWHDLQTAAHAMFTMDCELPAKPLHLDEMVELWAEGDDDA